MTAAIASKLADDVISGLDFVSLRIATLAGHTGSSRIVVEALNEVSPRAMGRRVWVSSRIRADKILNEVFKGDTRSRRSGDDLIIEATTDETEQLVRSFAALHGYAITEDDEISAMKARATARISAEIDRLQRIGWLKDINKVYKSLPPPKSPYNSFLAEQLRGVAQFDPSDLLLLRGRL